MPKPDPLAQALDAIKTPSGSSSKPKVLALFEHRPDVLESIIKARRDRNLSYSQIAKKLSTETPISPGAVQNWLNSQGVD